MASHSFPVQKSHQPTSSILIALALPLLGLLATSCSNLPDIPAAEQLEASIESSSGKKAEFNLGFLYISPYSTEKKLNHNLILMQDPKHLETYLSKTLQHKGPAITKHPQLSFNLRDIPIREGKDVQISFHTGTGDSANLFARLAPLSKANDPEYAEFDGTFEIKGSGDTQAWQIQLDTEETLKDGTTYNLSLKANVPLVDLKF